MKSILLSVLLLSSFVSVSQELDASFTGNKTDFNFYSYYTKNNSNKLNHFTYINYFYRNNNIYNNLSFGYFLDIKLNKKIYNWSFYQTETNILQFYFYNQLASGLGYYLLNKENIVITTNLGLIYRNQNDFRYLFRLKVVFLYKRLQFDSYNYIQPDILCLNDYNIIFFQTFTYKFLKNIHGKLFYWNFFNNFDFQNRFEYLTIGLSFNLKK